MFHLPQKSALPVIHDHPNPLISCYAKEFLRSSMTKLSGRLTLFVEQKSDKLSIFYIIGGKFNVNWSQFEYGFNNSRDLLLLLTQRLLAVFYPPDRQFQTIHSTLGKGNKELQAYLNTGVNLQKHIEPRKKHILTVLVLKRELCSPSSWLICFKIGAESSNYLNLSLQFILQQ